MKIWFLALAILLPAMKLRAQDHNEANYDESKVPAYTLPDVLKTGANKKVNSKALWEKTRRPEILRLFENNVYGQMPKAYDRITYTVVREEADAMGGKARLKQVVIKVSKRDTSIMINLLLFIPNGRQQPAPVFLLINNRGRENTDPERTTKSEFWPAEAVIDSGYAVAAFHVSDLAPDNETQFVQGVLQLYPEQLLMPNGMRAIGAWAWGASRVMDYFETDKQIDAKKVVLVGHSRGGKASLWAAAQDLRFAICVTNCSGNTGAALARRQFGERIRRINTAFPHWFCENYKKFNDREDSLPVDQHMLISLIAPRPVYATNATKDLWADPKGTFLALKNAEKVYALYGLSSKLPADPPEVGTPSAAPPLGYHIREGEHNLTLYDWNRFIVFANNYFNIHPGLSAEKKAVPVKIILDSDIGQDCDDAAAMALMHQFANRGEAEILATMFPMHDPMGAPAMDVINTYYGRPNIPIGTYKGNYEYKGKLYDHYNTKLARAFPHDLKRGEDAPDAVMLYRKILEKQPAGSVVVVVVGPERLLADLLQTGPDATSRLNGYDLVKQKVKFLSVMGAGFPSGDEWNIKIAPDAAKLVAETWPTPIVYSGYEIGNAIRTGSRLLTETDTTNPVRAAFENHPFVDKLTRDRQSWDQTAMLYAVKGARDCWLLQSNGSNAIDSTGKNKWLPGAAKNHAYLTLQKPASEMQKIIEDLMVAPPGAAKK